MNAKSPSLRTYRLVLVMFTATPALQGCSELLNIEVLTLDNQSDAEGQGSATGGGQGGGGGANEGGGGGSTINDCSESDYYDALGDTYPTVQAEETSEYVPRCIKITIQQGITFKTFTGQTFMMHPLMGGEGGIVDADSPVTKAGLKSDINQAGFSINKVGYYPFFCNNEKSHKGVIQVVNPPL